MKFTLATMTAVFAAAVFALPSPATNQLVTDFEIPPQSPEVLAAFKALPKEVHSPEKAGNTAVESKTLEARADIFFFVTADINWGGRQENLRSTPGQCYNLQNGWNDIVSSAGPDTGSCTLWENNGCSGSSLSGIRNPGIANLNAIGWGDRASSYRCS